MSEPIRIRCRENGPLVIQCPVEVVDHLGQPFPLPEGKEFVALCRCGRSQRKPFCGTMPHGKYTSKLKVPICTTSPLCRRASFTLTPLTRVPTRLLQSRRTTSPGSRVKTQCRPETSGESS